MAYRLPCRQGTINEEREKYAGFKNRMRLIHALRLQRAQCLQMSSQRGEIMNSCSSDGIQHGLIAMTTSTTHHHFYISGEVAPQLEQLIRHPRIISRVYHA